MAQRLELQAVLEALTPNVYFQPSATVDMDYPCIVYQRDDERVRYADNSRYFGMQRYQLTVIDRSPDSVILDMVKQLPLCSFERFFVVDGLNHDVFNIYF